MADPDSFHPDVIDRLVSALHDYNKSVSPHYDEVLHEVARRVAETQSVGKADIGALVLWKRIRANAPWAAKLMRVPDTEVRATTAVAIAAVRKPGVPVGEAAGKGRLALKGLPGFGGGSTFALGSAVLLAAAPDRMAVYDRRAHKGLEMLGIPLSSKSGRYRRYIEILEQLRQGVNTGLADWTNRHVDQALFWLGRP